MAAAPTLWPVQGPITGAFGSRIDPFTGEGAVHRGIDISAPYGTRVVAPADGDVVYADFMAGYGRMVVISHGNGIISRYPILNSGSWDDPQIPDRGFAWAQLALPGTNTFYLPSGNWPDGDRGRRDVTCCRRES